MTRRLFDQEIANLIADITAMGNMVDDRLQRTIAALRTQDAEDAQRVVDGDRAINMEQQRLDQCCMNLIALQQPIASDLRLIASCLKIVTDMERVGDQAADICEILVMGELGSNSLAMAHVVKMMETARTMFRRAVDVFIAHDVATAQAVCASDDEVDAMFSRIVLEVCNAITERPTSVMSDVDLIFITKYIERIGDHATNIAEWVIYMETGTHPDLNPSQGTKLPH